MKIEKIQKWAFITAIAACAYQVWTALGIFLETDAAASEYSEEAINKLIPSLDSADVGTISVTVTLLAVYVLYAITTFSLYRKAERDIHDFKLMIEKSTKSAVWSWFIPIGFLFLPRRRLKELETILVANQQSGFTSSFKSGIKSTRDCWWFGFIGYLVISRAKNPILADIAEPDDWSGYLSSINSYALVIALASGSLIFSYVFGMRYFKELFRMEELLVSKQNVD